MKTDNNMDNNLGSGLSLNWVELKNKSKHFSSPMHTGILQTRFYFSKVKNIIR
jgi:hypothetical protein